MEERYKGQVIRVTTEKDNSAYPWKPICKILDGTSREVIKQIDWQIGYATLDQGMKDLMFIGKEVKNSWGTFATSDRFIKEQPKLMALVNQAVGAISTSTQRRS